MSYASKVKIVPKDKQLDLVDILRRLPDVELVKYHHTHVKPGVIPVRYKGSLFEFIKSSEGYWELWYKSLIHMRIRDQTIVSYFNDVLLCWDSYEYGWGCS